MQGFNDLLEHGKNAGYPIEPRYFTRIRHFEQQFCGGEAYGIGHALFVLYSSFPVLLTPDLLHKLRFNFKNFKFAGEDQFIHPVAVSDLLMSGLCREVNRGIYEMPSSIRFFFFRLLKDLESNPDLVPGLELPNAVVSRIAAFTRYNAAQPNNKAYTAHEKAIQKAHLLNADMYLNPSHALNQIAQDLADAKTDTAFQRQLTLVTEQILNDLQLTELNNKPDSGRYVPQNQLQFLLTYTQAFKKFYIEDNKDEVDALIEKLKISPDNKVDPILLPVPYAGNGSSRYFNKSYKTGDALQLIAENKAKHERGEDASYLDLGNCGLTELPEELGQCTWLEVLVLSNEWDEWEAETRKWEKKKSENQGEANRLYKLDGVERLENLNKLFSGGGIMNSWPLHDLSPLAKLQNLQSLDCRHTEVQDLSPLAALQKLQVLNCSHTKVQDLSPLSGLRNLQALECRNKQVQDLSPLSNLDNLRSLNCSDTQIKDLSLVSNMKKLQSLSFWNTQVHDLSPLAELHNLQSLYCHMTRVADLSPLCNLQSLNELNCSTSNVQDLSPLAKLQNLQWLICSDTQIQDLSPLSTLQNLRFLICSHTQIQDLSPLSSLQNLQTLSCDKTPVQDLSPLVGLQNLQELYCGSTQVQDLSPLSNLNHLTILNLSGNQISDLTLLLPLIKKGVPVTLEDPKVMFLDNRRYGINLHNNPLTTPPTEIVKQGNTAILNWFAERERKQQFQNTEIKLILIGNSTVGKTSLSRYLRERVYEHGQPSTHGIHNYRWAPEGRKLEVNIWDFGGQEYYHATHRLFLSRNSVYALVWDAQTDAGGYGDTDIHYEHDPAPQRVRLEHFPHRWWLHNIRHYTRDSNPPVPVLLVQNKSARDGIRRVSSDLEAAPYSLQPEWLDNHIDLAALAGDAPEAEGRKWARRFEEFEERLLDKLEAQLTHYEFAIYHRDIRDEVRRRAAAGVNDMSYADFEALCRGFDADAKMDLVRVYLHDITGDILYYPNHPRLRERVFLRPDWVCNRIYAILSREVLAREGLFDLDWVQQALQCDAEEARDFVELMREFELIFDDSDEEGLPTGQYVAPEYLPDACPKPDSLEAVKDFAKPTHAFTLWFPDFLPKSHIARFVAHWGSQAQQRLFWKNGLLFRTADCAALVERNEGKQIRVDIQAGQPTREAAMQQIFQSFLKLEDGQAGFAVSMDGADFVDWSAVVEARRTQAQEIACRSTADNRPKYLPLSKFQTLLQPVKMTAKKIFLSYAKADRAYLDAARRHLRSLERQGAIALWDDTQLLPGEAWDAAIRRELAAADIILFLVSADLMATDYIWDTEMKEAMARAARGEVAVVPVIIRSCVWDDAPFAQYTALPGKGKPISSWSNPDEAWAEVTGRIRSFVQGAKGRPPAGPPPAVPPTAPAGTQIRDSKNILSGNTISAGGNVHIGDVYHSGADASKTGKTTAAGSSPNEKQGIARAIELKIKVINKLREALALEDDPTRSVRYEVQLEAAEAELEELKAKLG